MITLLTNQFIVEKQTIVITGFIIQNIILHPFISANIYLYLIDEEDNQYPRNIILTGDDYSNWGSDDHYLTSYISDNILTILGKI